MKITQITYDEMMQGLLNKEDPSRFWAIIGFDSVTYNAVGGRGYRVRAIATLSFTKLEELKKEPMIMFARIEEEKE